MKIAYLAAGAGGMYCGNCLHDSTLANALIAAGEDVLLVPTYTPLKTDEKDVSHNRIFFSGLNVYLQQKSWLFRHTPWFFDKFLESPWLINQMLKLAVSTQPEDLGDLTLSMLQGEHGKQAKEIEKLTEWLADEVKPDIVQLSNCLLIGMGHKIRERLNVPVVCTLSGEDMFLEGLNHPTTQKAYDLICEKAQELDGFVSLNNYYANRMAGLLKLARDRIAVIEHGLVLDGHGHSSRTGEEDDFIVGYLARITTEKGLHHLIDALEILAQDTSLPHVKVRAAGYLGKPERKYYKSIEKQVSKAKLEDRFEYLGEVTREEKIAFIQSLDCMTMPTTYPESKGLPVLESLANGVPVIVPEHGVFPEVLADTNAGLMHEPENPSALAAKIKELIHDREQLKTLGTSGRNRIHQQYHCDRMAARTIDWYQEIQKHYSP